MAVFFAQTNFRFEHFSLKVFAGQTYDGRSGPGHRFRPIGPDHIDPALESLTGISALLKIPGFRYEKSYVHYGNGGGAFIAGGFGLSADRHNHLTGGRLNFLYGDDIPVPVASNAVPMNYSLSGISLSVATLMKVAKTSTKADDRALLGRLFSGDDLIVGSDKEQGDGRGDYIISGGGNDLVIGGDGSDLIKAGSGADVIFGGTPGAASESRDTIYGGDGNDLLVGQSASSVLYGGRGNDVLLPGLSISVAPDSLMHGGDGADTFAFYARQADSWGEAYVVADFTDGVDKIAILTPDITFEALTITQLGANVAIGVNGVTAAVLRNLEVSALTADDFLFGDGAKAAVGRALRYFMDHWDYAA